MKNEKTAAMWDLEAWLGETIRQVDSSLLEAWEPLTAPRGAQGRELCARGPRWIIANPACTRVDAADVA